MTAPAQPLSAALTAGTVTLDGGLSNQLAAQGHDLTGDLWTARLLADAPDQITAAHLAYLRAGARVLTTASYQASLEGFARHGIGAGQAAELIGDSVRLARKAIQLRTDELATAGPAAAQAWVAASVGPYGAALADGSEYRGHYGLTARELTRFHRPRISALAAAEPDVLALETIPDTDEASVLLDAIADTGIPAWLSYTIDADRTRAGQPLDDAFTIARGSDQVIAVGINCCDPRDVTLAVSIAAEVTGKPVVAYPNSGEHWDPAARSWHGNPRFGPALVQSWHAAGATLIGGCCRVGPAQITALAAALRPQDQGGDPRDHPASGTAEAHHSQSHFTGS